MTMQQKSTTTPETISAAVSATTSKVAEKSTSKKVLSKEDFVAKTKKEAEKKTPVKKSTPAEKVEAKTPEKDAKAEAVAKVVKEVKEKSAKTPAKVAKKAPVKKEAKILFPATLEVENLGTLKKVTINDYKELKEREDLVYVFYWDAKQIKELGYNDLDAPETKISDLFKGHYDLCVPVYYKETKEHVVVVSQITESIFELCVPEWYKDLEEAEQMVKLCNDLVFQIYEMSAPAEEESPEAEKTEEEAE